MHSPGYVPSAPFPRPPGSGGNRGPPGGRYGGPGGGFGGPGRQNTFHATYNNVFVNAYRLNVVPGSVAYRYHVQIIAEGGAGTGRIWKRHLTQNFEDPTVKFSVADDYVIHDILAIATIQSQRFGACSASLVFDKRSTLYSSKQLTVLEQVLYRNTTDSDYFIGDKITVTLIPSKASVLKLDDFTVEGVSGQENHDLRAFFELLSSQGLVEREDAIRYRNGDVFFTTGPEDYKFGIEFRKGFAKSCRLVSTGKNNGYEMKLVIDPMTAPFYKQQTLASAYESFVGHSRGDLDEKVRSFVRVFKNVKVVVSYRATKVLSVRKLTAQAVGHLRFMNKDGVEMSVVDYYRTVVGKIIQHIDFPALEVKFGNSGRIGYYPLEMLAIVPGQKLPMSKFPYISMTFVDEIRKRSATKPDVRLADIREIVGMLVGNADIMNRFGVSLDNSSNLIPCTLIAKPKVLVNGCAALVPNEKSGFPIRAGRYMNPISLQGKWYFLRGEKVSDAVMNDTIHKFMGECRSRGVEIVQPSVHYFDSGSRELDHWAKMFDLLVRDGVKFVMLLDSKTTPSHHLLKWFESMYAVQTQHLTVETMGRVRSFENILNKTNLKLGGLNHVVEFGLPELNTLFDRDAIYVMGYDVSHPPPGREGDCSSGSMSICEYPSVVGIATNSGPQAQTFTGNFFYQKPRREEVDIDQLKYATRFGLRLRKKQRPNAGPIDIVVIYRDGVSEGQMEMVRERELPAIRQSLEAEGYGKAKIIVIVSTKRHNRRFFRETGENILPATLITQGITRANANEFYLQSANAIQGTARTTVYEILTNETSWDFNMIQTFTHGLCYSHQIVTSAISQPEPVYQAHELAKRGRNIFSECCHENPVPVTAGQTDYEALNDQLSYFKNALVQYRFTA